MEFTEVRTANTFPGFDVCCYFNPLLSHLSTKAVARQSYLLAMS